MTTATSKNKTETETFVFTSENMDKARAIIAQYPVGREASALLPLLDLAQRQCGGWLPQKALEGIAHLLKLPSMRVQEVASFYTMFNLRPVGKYHIQVCRTTPCWLRGAEDILQSCETYLGIHCRETTEDGLFTLSEVECLGACIHAPMVQINDDYYEHLTPETLSDLLRTLSISVTSSPPDVKSQQEQQMPRETGLEVKKPTHRKKKGVDHVDG